MYWVFIPLGIESLFENLVKTMDFELQKNGNTQKEFVYNSWVSDFKKCFLLQCLVYLG